MPISQPTEREKAYDVTGQSDGSDAGHLLSNQSVTMVAQDKSFSSFADLDQILLTEPQAKQAEEEEQQQLMPDLLAFAEATLADSHAEAELSASSAASVKPSEAAKEAGEVVTVTASPRTMGAAPEQQDGAYAVPHNNAGTEPVLTHRIETEPATMSSAQDQGVVASRPEQELQHDRDALRSQQAEDIAAELFDEMLSDAVQTMAGSGGQQ